jgi:hypothetical protein
MDIRCVIYSAREKLVYCDRVSFNIGVFRELRFIRTLRTIVVTGLVNGL